MALCTMRGQGSIDEIKDYLVDGVSNSGISNQLLHAITRESKNVKSCLLVFEKWYYRTQSTSSLTVMITEDEDQIVVDAIGAGGGSGLFSFSFGAEHNFTNIVKNLLLTKGFKD